MLMIIMLENLMYTAYMENKMMLSNNKLLNLLEFFSKYKFKLNNVNCIIVFEFWTFF